MIHQSIERAHAEARRIHEQSCPCPRCAPPRRRSLIQGLADIWHVAEPADRACIKWGLGIGFGIDAIALLAHSAPAIAAALGF